MQILFQNVYQFFYPADQVLQLLHVFFAEGNQDLLCIFASHNVYPVIHLQLR